MAMGISLSACGWRFNWCICQPCDDYLALSVPFDRYAFWIRVSRALRSLVVGCTGRISWSGVGKTAWAERPKYSPAQIVGWYSNTSTFVLELPAGSRWIRKLQRNFAGCPL